MNIPERRHYDRALQLASSVLLMPGSNLRGGSVDMTTLMGVPKPYARGGSFAVVYRFTLQDGKTKRALRCFTKHQPHLLERYSALQVYFEQFASDITAQLTYYEKGINVTFEDGTADPWPLIDMEWIEGVPLIQAVEAARQSGPAAQTELETLVQAWLELVRRMVDAKIGHDDLCGDNIMRRASDGRLVIVDYDGIYVPGVKQGLVTDGKPDYQHRQVSSRLYDERMGDFSALLIYTALVATQADPTLWDRHMEPGNENLLFLKSDLDSPGTSQLVAEIRQLSDQRARDALEMLLEAYQAPLRDMPPLLSLIDPIWIQQKDVDSAVGTRNKDRPAGIPAKGLGKTAVSPGSPWKGSLLISAQAATEPTSSPAAIPIGSSQTSLAAPLPKIWGLPSLGVKWMMLILALGLLAGWISFGVQTVSLTRERATATAQINTLGNQQAQAQATIVALQDAAASATALTGQLESRTYGPVDGQITMTTENQVAAQSANVSYADFYASAEFTNPSTSVWDYGFEFRGTGDSAYRVFVSSDGSWTFSSGANDIIDYGTSDAIDTSDSGYNTITLVAIGSQALLSVNDTYITHLDVSSNTGAADISACTAFLSNDFSSGGLVTYSNFYVQDLDH